VRPLPAARHTLSLSEVMSIHNNNCVFLVVAEHIYCKQSRTASIIDVDEQTDVQLITPAMTLQKRM